MKVPRLSTPDVSPSSFAVSPMYRKVQRSQPQLLRNSSFLSTCRSEPDEWRLNCRVVHDSIQFKLGIQRIQQATVTTMPCLLDPLCLHQFPLRPDDAIQRRNTLAIIERDGRREPPPVPKASSSPCLSSLKKVVTAPSTTEIDASTYSYFLRNELWQNEMECSSIISSAQLLQLRTALPFRFRDATFERCYCLAQDGDRLETLLYKTEHASHTIIVIETTNGELLGGYCTEPWSGRRRYHGNGQSFLFASQPDNAKATTGTDKLHIFPWTGVNDYCQVCDNYLAMGGQGSFGWRVCSELRKGQTGWCGTYGNPPLVQGGFFDVTNIEVFAIHSARS